MVTRNQRVKIGVHLYLQQKEASTGDLNQCQKIAWKFLIKYLGMAFDRGLSWCKQNQNTRATISVVYIHLKPFFNNRRESDQSNLRAFKVLIGNISSLFMAVCSPRLKRIEQVFLQTLRGSPQIPWNKIWRTNSSIHDS